MARERTVRSQMGPFGILPLWMLERVMTVAHETGKGADAAARAIYVYAVLAAKYANRDHVAWPKREQLSAALDMSLRSVSSALRLLRDAGVLQTTLRHRPDGSVSGLEYLLVQVPPKTESDTTADHQASPCPMEDADHQAQLCLMDASHRAPGDTTPCTAVQGLLKEEPDPSNQIQREREAAAPPASPPDPKTPEPQAPSPEPSAVDPLEAFRFAWNALTTDPLPRCHTLTPKRRRLIRACLVERPIGDWHEIFSRIERSSFCRKNERGWLASLDWLIAGPDPALKVLEGQYDDHERAERPPTAKEMEHVQQMLRAWGGCRHDPPCDDRQTCVARIVRRLRGEEAA